MMPVRALRRAQRKVIAEAALRIWSTGEDRATIRELPNDLKTHQGLVRFLADNILDVMLDGLTMAEMMYQGELDDEKEEE